jgi:DNA-binding NarL/FixJ family response regulator
MPVLARTRVCSTHEDEVACLGLSAALAKYSDFELVDGTKATAFGPGFLPSLHAPDVIVASYLHGVSLSRRLLTAKAPARVLVVTGIDREWEIRAALGHGVRGYLLMGCPLDELAEGVRAVHRGTRYLCSRAAARLAESMSGDPLTPREEEVLRLTVDGLCNKAIGRRLEIAPGTVKSHLKAAFQKLNVQSRTQAVAEVERRGLLSAPASAWPIDARRCPSLSLGELRRVPPTAESHLERRRPSVAEASHGLAMT